MTSNRNPCYSPMTRRLVYSAVLLASAHTLPAQETTGRLRGRVLARDGMPLPPVQVALSGPALSGERILRVDGSGYFVAHALPPGLYRATIRTLGYREVVAEGVAIRLGQTTSLGEVTLRPAQSILAPIIIRYDASQIDPVSTTIGSTLDVRFAEQLPIGRDFASLLTLLPQANASSWHRDGVNIAGATGLENAYFIDGMNVTEGFRNSGGTTLPYSFIDHVELKTGGYEAEFGRALGGIISVTTRSGSNEPHVSAFSYYTASSLGTNTARSRIDFGTGDYGRYDVGIAKGGPLVRDRLWYYVAYDFATAREDVALLGNRYTDRTRSHQFAGKLTWEPHRETNVTAVVVGDPTTRDMVGNSFWGVLPIESLGNVEPYLGYWDQGSVAASISARRTIGSKLLLESVLSRSEFHDRTGPNSANGGSQPLVIDGITGQWSGGYGNQWDRRGSRTAVQLAASYAAGPHSSKVGFQFDENNQRENWQWPGNGPNGAGVIFRNGVSSYMGLLLDHRARVRSRAPSMFVQSSLQPHRALRVNTGLRWDAQYFHSATTGRSGAITDQFQPRFGVILYPSPGREQKLAMSAGRFYEQLPTQPVTWFWGGLHQHFDFYGQNPLVDASGATSFFWDDVPAAGIIGQHYDEVTVSYEANFGRRLTWSVRGVRRLLREVLQEMAASGSPPQAVLANPGRGDFAALPEPDTHFDALELTLRQSTAGKLALLASYVWSKHYGNYVGVFNQDDGNPNAHASATTANSGPLPNDRPHVFKAHASYAMTEVFTVGAAALAQSGTPLSDFGRTASNPTAFYLTPRGGAGRTPWLYDFNLRGTYDLRRVRRLDLRLVADALHILSQRKATRVEQLRYLDLDASGNPTSPNPFYRHGTAFQPPMSLRVGIELGQNDRRGNR